MDFLKHRWIFYDLLPEELTALLSLILTLSVLLWIVLHYLQSRDLPPGPYGLPVVGYLPFLGDPAHEKLTQLRHRYGPIFSLQLGSVYVVVLNDFKSVHEAFVTKGDHFCNRPDMMPFVVDDRTSTYFAAMNGSRHREMRRFALKTFRDFGVGKSNFESNIQVELHNFLKELENLSRERKLVDFSHQLETSASNIICTLVFGRRFEYTDRSFKDLRHTMSLCLKHYAMVTRRVYFPWLSRIPMLKDPFCLQEATTLYHKVLDFCDGEVNRHQKSEGAGTRTDDFIHAFYAEKQNGGLLLQNENSLSNTCHTMLDAGSETVSTALKWAVLYMATYPSMQNKVRQEIEKVIGKDRLPSVQYRSQTPFTEAVILEILRVANILPLSLLHSCSHDETVGGYRIPKGSVIICNLWNVHNDPQYWEQPERFNPNRFIANDGSCQKPDYFIPFSIGKRMCTGESMARMQLYLYFVSMMQKFRFYVEPGETVCLDAFNYISRIPKKFNVRIARVE